MQLSKNFTLNEFTRSRTAVRLGISNTPSEEQIETIQLFADTVLQPLRDILGPISITSGYRSPELNKAVGGSKNSAHMCLDGAVAADIQCPPHSLHAIAVYVKQLHLPATQVIVEPTWVHIGSKKVKMAETEFLSAELLTSGKMRYTVLTI